MQADDHFFIGISDRTNEEGARANLQLSLEKHDYSTTIIYVKKGLHLKSEVNYLGDGNLLMSASFYGHPAFKDYNQIKVKKEEIYAANSLRINDVVLVPARFSADPE